MTGTSLNRSNGSTWPVNGEGLSTSKVHRPILAPHQLKDLVIEATVRYDRNPLHFHLGVGAKQILAQKGA